MVFLLSSTVGEKIIFNKALKILKIKTDSVTRVEAPVKDMGKP